MINKSIDITRLTGDLWLFASQVRLHLFMYLLQQADEQGELVFNASEYARVYQVDRTALSRLLNEMAERKVIAKEMSSGKTKITICEYSHYVQSGAQNSANYANVAQSVGAGTVAAKGENENKETKEKESSPCTPSKEEKENKQKKERKDVVNNNEKETEKDNLACANRRKNLCSSSDGNISMLKAVVRNLNQTPLEERKAAFWQNFMDYTQRCDKQGHDFWQRWKAARGEEILEEEAVEVVEAVVVEAPTEEEQIYDHLKTTLALEDEPEEKPAAIWTYQKQVEDQEREKRAAELKAKLAADEERKNAVFGKFHFYWTAVIAMYDEEEGELVGEVLRFEAQKGWDWRDRLESFLSKGEEIQQIIAVHQEEIQSRKELVNARRDTRAAYEERNKAEAEMVEAKRKAGKKVNGEDTKHLDAGFEEFWAMCDPKVKRQQTLEEWRKLGMEEKIGALLRLRLYYLDSGREDRKAADPNTYLRERRWEDELQEVDEDDLDDWTLDVINQGVRAVKAAYGYSTSKQKNH